jgi:metal-responsive CopG/Arc/MetJ family transcriptional regulator
MQTKKKITITIDEGLCDAIDQAAKRFKMARSQLAQEALSLWLKKQTGALMKQGYREMAEEDRQLAESALEAQREIWR